jgi:hypothetical protein
MTSLTPELERTARRRAALKFGWFVHAGAYVAVNLLLATLSAASGRHWAVFPALGWGIGVAIHGIVVFLVAGGGFDSLVERERQQLAAQKDPW